MSAMPPGTSPPNILERHVKTMINLDGMVAHKFDGTLGPFRVIHSRDRIPSCKYCRALGITEIKDHTFEEGKR